MIACVEMPVVAMRQFDNDFRAAMFNMGFNDAAEFDVYAYLVAAFGA